MKTKRTVSLFLYLAENKEVVLSRRSEDQSRPGLLQATAHGEIEENEDDNDALARELAEETAINFDQVSNLEFIKGIEVGQAKPEKCRYYLADIEINGFNQMKPTEEVSEYVRVGKDDIMDIVPYSIAEMKNVDVMTKKVMFDDELEVLKEIFKKKFN